VLVLSVLQDKYQGTQCANLFSHYFSFVKIGPLLPNHCRYRGLLLHLITLDTHTHTHGRTALDKESALRKRKQTHITQH